MITMPFWVFALCFFPLLVLCFFLVWANEAARGDARTARASRIPTAEERGLAAALGREAHIDGHGVLHLDPVVVPAQRTAGELS